MRLKGNWRARLRAFAEPGVENSNIAKSLRNRQVLRGGLAI
jgi:hypothetical protein